MGDLRASSPGDCPPPCPRGMGVLEPGTARNGKSDLRNPHRGLHVVRPFPSLGVQRSLHVIVRFRAFVFRGLYIIVRFRALAFSIYVYMNICIYAYVYICIYLYMYMCICVYLYVYVYTYVCMYICICVYIYVYIYIHVYVYMYMCI